MGKAAIGKAGEVNNVQTMQGLSNLINECVLNQENSVGPFVRLEKHPWLKCEGWALVGMTVMYLQGNSQTLQHINSVVITLCFTNEETNILEKLSTFTKTAGKRK